MQGNDSENTPREHGVRSKRPRNQSPIIAGLGGVIGTVIAIYFEDTLGLWSLIAGVLAAIGVVTVAQWLYPNKTGGIDGQK